MLKIITENNVELPFVKESLSLNFKNTVFFNSFDVQYSEYPFLIEETPEVIAELGPSTISSLLRKNQINVKVNLNDKVYTGILKVNEYLSKFRKCSLKFGSSLLTIMDKKPADYLGIHKFDANVSDYETEVDAYFDQSLFMGAVNTHCSKTYPEIDFTFATMSVSDLHTQKINDPWALWGGSYNQRLTNGGDIAVNTRTLISGNQYNVLNNTTYVPMVFLLAFIEKPLEYFGFKLSGSFKEHELSSKILIVPELGVTQNTTLKLKTTDDADTELYLMHPVVDLKRFVPDWTFGELINNLQNWRFLDIDFNEENKELIINLNSDYFNSLDYVDLSDKHIKTFPPSTNHNNNYVFGSVNEKDKLILNSSGVFLESSLEDDTEDLKNNFKTLKEPYFPILPRVIFTTKEELSSDGVGLVLQDGTHTVDNINGEGLSFVKESGLMLNEIKQWSLFRLNALSFKAETFISDYLINKIKLIKKVYFDYNLFAVKSFAYKTGSTNNKVSLELENLSAGNSLVNNPNLNPSISIASIGYKHPNTAVWFIKVDFTFLDFTSGVNGVITAKEIVGGVPNGFELTANTNSLSGEIYIEIGENQPLRFFNVSLEKNGVVSNISTVGIGEVTTPVPKMTLAKVVEETTALGGSTKQFTIAFETGFTPVNGVIYLQKIVTGTNTPDGSPITTNVTLNQASYSVTFPAGNAGTYNAYVVADGETSTVLGWLVIG